MTEGEYIDEINRLKAIIDRDRTGMVAALGKILGTVRSYSWIPNGE